MKRKGVLLCLLIGILCLTSSFALLPFGNQAKAATLSDDFLDFESVYTLNSVIDIPASKIVYNGKEYNSTIKVISPDGNAYALSSESINAEQSGVYTVVYYAMINGRYVSVEKQFTVSQSTFTFSGERSSYYYGSHKKYATEKQGLVVSLAQGETLYYNKIIDLAKLDGNTVFSLFVTPGEEPLADADKLFFTFTDIYDENNYVTVRLQSLCEGTADWSNNHTYVTAKTGDQTEFVGLEYHSAASSTFEVAGSIFNAKTGSPIFFSMGGYLYSSWNIGEIEYGLSFDLSNKTIYSKTENHTKMITDLDNSLLYTNLWEGFTTGEVFMSVYAEEYRGGKTEFVFTDIAGESLNEFDFNTNTKPIINVNTEGYSATDIPTAIVNENYKIFSANAYDIYEGSIDPVVKVFYGYYSTNPTRVDVKDGYFKPTREGIYTVEYSVVNKNGIKNTKTIDVTALEQEEKLGITLEGKKTVGGVGREVKVVDSYELTNVCGKSSVEIFATLKDNQSIKYSIGEDLIFVPYYAGVYEVSIEYSDYLFDMNEKFDINITVEDGSPLITETPLLPNYLIRGKQYSIPYLEGYVFTTGKPESKTCKTFIQEGNGVRHEVTDRNYTVGDFETVTLIYELSDGTVTIEKSFTLKIVDTTVDGKFSIEKYFVADNSVATTNAESDCLQLVTNKDATWEFINLLVASKVEWRIRTVENAMSFESMDFYLVDAKNPEQKVKFSFNQDGSYLNVRINDEDRLLLTTSMEKLSKEDLYLKYDEQFNLFTINNTSELLINSYFNGEKFDGFNSGMVILKAGVSGVCGDAKISFRKLNNQNIRKTVEDKTSPIVYYSMHRGNYTIGDKVTFAVAKACDVFDPYTKLSFKVMDSNGDYVTADDGTVLDGTQSCDVEYSYTIDSFGLLEVLYNAIDSANNLAEYSYVIHSVDTVAPSITLLNPVKVGKVGENIEIASYQLSDNLGKDGVEVFVTITNPNGVMQQMKDKSFKASLAGTYVIHYYVTDAAGNVTIESYSIVVS